MPKAACVQREENGAAGNRVSVEKWKAAQSFEHLVGYEKAL